MSGGDLGMHGDIERLVAEESTRIDQHYGALERLGDDPVFIMLRDAELTGMTGRRWDAASEALIAATSRLSKSREAVAVVIRLLRADPPDLEEAERLLLGRSIPLTLAETPKEDRRPPASASTELRFTLHAVRDFVVHDLGTAQRLVENVTSVVASARPRLDQLTARLDALSTGEAGELSALRRDLDEAWRLLAADPLALGPMAAAGPDGLGPLEALDAGLARLVRLARLARLRAGVVELEALEARIRAQRDELVTGYGVPDAPPAPDAAQGLATRLDADLPALDPTALDLAALERALAEAAQAAERADQMFTEWCLLWGRLEGYRLRAARRGRAARPELAALYARARQALEEAPCDLGRAERAVRAYMSMEREDDPGQGVR